MAQGSTSSHQSPTLSVSINTHQMIWKMLKAREYYFIYSSVIYALKARKNKIVFNTIQEYHCYKVKTKSISLLKSS